MLSATVNWILKLIDIKVKYKDYKIVFFDNCSLNKKNSNFLRFLYKFYDKEVECRQPNFSMILFWCLNHELYIIEYKFSNLFLNNFALKF